MCLFICCSASNVCATTEWTTLEWNSLPYCKLSSPLQSAKQMLITIHILSVFFSSTVFVVQFDTDIVCYFLLVFFSSSQTCSVRTRLQKKFIKILTHCKVHKIIIYFGLKPRSRIEIFLDIAKNESTKYTNCTQNEYQISMSIRITKEMKQMFSK